MSDFRYIWGYKNYHIILTESYYSSGLWQAVCVESISGPGAVVSLRLPRERTLEDVRDLRRKPALRYAFQWLRASIYDRWEET